jgi:hypothetical protein
MSDCLCIKAQKLDTLKRILENGIKWYHENKHDQELIYDESYIIFNKLNRGHCEEILKLIAEEHYL